MRIELKDVKEARALLDRGSIGGGLSAEINLPSTVLRNYDVLVDYPNREFTIAAPGVIKFHGKAAKATIGPANGLVQIPGTIEGETHNLGLDVGATISFISSEFTSKWLKAHPAWPHMKGAVGPANMWGLEEEPGWELLRVPRVEYGGAALTNVLAASFPKEIMKWFEQRAGVPTIGLIGTDALLNYTVGIDYAHSTVYFEKTSKLNFANMDVVGLVLRPEADERYTVIGIADYQGKPSVPDVQKGDVLLTVDGGRATGATMGQVWSLLSGSPGTVRTLTLERGGKQIVVKATVRRFLGDVGTAAPGRPSGAKLRN
jgi:hypothetical protein